MDVVRLNPQPPSGVVGVVGGKGCGSWVMGGWRGRGSGTGVEWGVGVRMEQFACVYRWESVNS